MSMQRWIAVGGSGPNFSPLLMGMVACARLSWRRAGASTFSPRASSPPFSRLCAPALGSFSCRGRRRFFAAAVHLVDRGPGARLGLFGADAFLFVPFFDVFGLALLLVGLGGLTAARHGQLLLPVSSHEATG